MKNNNVENNEYIEIGRRLFEFRKLKNLTQNDVEKHLGIKQETISMIESGNRKIQKTRTKFSALRKKMLYNISWLR